MRDKVVIFILLMLLPISGKALSCDNSEQARLRKLATNVNTSYEYVEDGENVTFNVTLTNITSELYVVDSVTGNRYSYNGTNEITITGYKHGTNIRYSIYPSKEDCTRGYLTVKYVNLPYYNKYYKNELCKDKKYNICSKWRKVELTEEQFKKKIAELDREAEKKNEENVQTKNTIFDNIASFVFKYYPFIILGGLAIYTPIEIIRRKKDPFRL